MKKSNLLLAGGIGLGLFMLSGNGRAQTLPGDAGSSTESGSGTEADATAVTPKTQRPSTFPLRRGSRGEPVRKLQAWLGVAKDAVFGGGTEAALLKRTGKKVVNNAAELSELLSQVSATPAQTAPLSPTNTPLQLAGALFTACFEWRLLPVIGGPLARPIVVKHERRFRFRTQPDYATIQRIVAGRSDNELRQVLGVYRAQYGVLSGGDFIHVLDNWNSIALNLWGLMPIRVRLARLR